MKSLRLNLLLTVCLISFVGLAEAQTNLTLGAKNKVVVDGPTFIPFGAESSNQIASAMDNGFNVSQCRASGIKGDTLEVGPAANGFEIGERRKVKKKKKKKNKRVQPTVCDLNFSGGSDLSPGSTFGISVSGEGSFTLDLAVPGNCPSPVTCEAADNNARKCSAATNQKCSEADANGNILKRCKSNGKKCVSAK